MGRNVKEQNQNNTFVKHESLFYLKRMIGLDKQILSLKKFRILFSQIMYIESLKKGMSEINSKLFFATYEK